MKPSQAAPEGIIFFLKRPYLWWRPLLAALFVGFIMLLLFMGIVWWTFPTESSGFFSHLLGILGSVGLGFLSLIVFWFIFLPVILAFFYEGFMRKVLKDLNQPIVSESFYHSIHSTFSVLFATLGTRILWVFLMLISVILLGFLTPFISHFAMGHLMAIDSMDLALGLQGWKGSERIAFIKKQKRELLIFGLIAGLINFLLSLSIIGWLFWIPSMLAGAALYSRGIDRSFLRDAQ